MVAWMVEPLVVEKDMTMVVQMVWTMVGNSVDSTVAWKVGSSVGSTDHCLAELLVE